MRSSIGWSVSHLANYVITGRDAESCYDITIDFSRECLQVFPRLGVEDSEACPLLDEPFRLGPGRHTAASDRRYDSLLLKVEGCNGSLP